MVEEPDDTAVNIRADYVAKHGAPSAAAPKIFFRYYFVNLPRWSSMLWRGFLIAICRIIRIFGAS